MGTIDSVVWVTKNCLGKMSLNISIEYDGLTKILRSFFGWYHHLSGQWIYVCQNYGNNRNVKWVDQLASLHYTWSNNDGNIFIFFGSIRKQKYCLGVYVFNSVVYCWTFLSVFLVGRFWFAKNLEATKIFGRVDHLTPLFST